MNYLRSLLPNTLPNDIDPSDDLKIWQERILHIFLFASAVIGVVMLLVVLSNSDANSDNLLLSGSIATIAISLVLFVLRRISYWIRSIIYLAAFFAFANLLFIQGGWGGISLTLLLIFSLLASVFLFQRPSRIGLGIALATLLFWTVLAYSGSVFANYFTTGTILLDTALVILGGFIGNFAIITLKEYYLVKKHDLEDLKEKSHQLEQQYIAQSTTLEDRMSKLRKASEISKITSSILNPQALIQQVAELLKNSFDLYYVGVFLIDPAREYAVLRYGTGDAGRKMVAARHRLAMGGYSMIGWATQTRKARIALDIGEEAVHFDNPNLPDTRSELALPIVSPTDILGALSIQSTQPNAFDESDLLIFQSIADSLAIALENATSFDKTQRALDDIRVLNKAFVQQAWGEELSYAGDLKYTFDNSQVVSENQGNIVKVPLVLRDETIGYIDLEVEGNDLSPEQQDFIQTISSQLTVALENARLLEETQRAAMQEQKLNDLSSQFSRALTIEDILKTAVIEFGKLPSVSEASISLLPPDEFATQKPRGTSSEGRK